MLDIVSKRYINFGVSLLMLALSLILFFSLKLNFGIDISGGTQTEYSYEGTLDIEALKPELTKISADINAQEDVINTTNIYAVTGEKSFIVEAGFNRNIEETELEGYKIEFKSRVTQMLQTRDSSISFLKYINIGASFGDYIKDTAKTTLLIAIIGITIYVAYAFSQAVGGISSMSFAVVTIITLFHDVFIASGIYVLISAFFPEFKIDTFFVTALLTILGYSINDTIVVSDRIRANLKTYGGKKKKDLAEIINLSINETISRSIYTSLTLIFVLFAILVFGPESIAGFTLLLILGTIIGTYSSIFIASPMIYEINKNKKLEVYKKKQKSEEDLIVV